MGEGVLNFKLMKSKWLSQKDGYVSIEAVVAISFFLMIFFLTLAFFTYIQPHSAIQREVHVLATIAERQGGLTPADISLFEEKLQSYPFIRNSSKNIEVSAVSQKSGIDVSNVTPLGLSGNHYITRDSKEIITITAKVPSNNTLMKPILNFFGIEFMSDYYIISESVLSERY